MHVLYKPVGGSCSQHCDYCFYKAPGGRARLDVARAYFEQARGWASVPFALQGGEPTLAGLEWVKEAVCMGRSMHGDRLHCSMQTNGIAIDQEWAEYLADERFLVGVSVDGPDLMHDARRGEGSHARAMQGWVYLERARANRNVLCVVSRTNVLYPNIVYKHLRYGMGARYMQFIPLVSELDGNSWGRFMLGVLQAWREHDVGSVSVLNFDAALQAMDDGRSSMCTGNRTCGTCVMMEHDGSVYSCDHFSTEDHYLGSVFEAPIARMVASSRQRAFGVRKALLPEECHRCDVLGLCWGGCPRERDARGYNVLCNGHRMMFEELVRTSGR